jgi:hypothetical protein
MEGRRSDLEGVIGWVFLNRKLGFIPSHFYCIIKESIGFLSVFFADE